MIAFHFPPSTGSSGIQRTLRFVQHLPALGWQPIVLTVNPRAHERTSQDLMADIPAGVRVIQAFALDTSRHLAIAGRYPGWLARPDRWCTWQWQGTVQGLRAIREFSCDAIWSTYPIATAHQIGEAVHRRSGVPWVADFRDPMAQDGYPADPRTWRSYKGIEERAVQLAARSVFTTPGAARMYRERYPTMPSERLVVIENGYDESTFAATNGTGAATTAIHPGRVTLLHSGIVYPSERDPTHLLAALALLKARGVINAANFCLRFRASGHDTMIERLARAAAVTDLIELSPAVAYREALQEMLRADALLVLQASNCNAQIPAKLYEYLRAGRPIIGLTDPAGDTADVLQRAGIAAVAPLDSVAAICDLLQQFITQPQLRATWAAPLEAAQRTSRHSRAIELAQLLDTVTRQTAS